MVLGVPLCLWQISPCTFVDVPAGHAHLTRNCVMHEEGNSGCFCATHFTAMLDIHGMLSQGYAEGNSAMPWHRQAARKGDGFSPFDTNPEQRELSHH